MERTEESRSSSSRDGGRAREPRAAARRSSLAVQLKGLGFQAGEQLLSPAPVAAGVVQLKADPGTGQGAPPAGAAEPAGPRDKLPPKIHGYSGAPGRAKVASIYFRLGRDDLDGSDRAALGKIAARLPREMSVTVDLFGHADISGNDRENQKLSSARARRVRDVIRASDPLTASSKGKFSRWFKVVGKGTTGSHANRAKSRRVDVYFYTRPPELDPSVADEKEPSGPSGGAPAEGAGFKVPKISKTRLDAIERRLIGAGKKEGVIEWQRKALLALVRRIRKEGPSDALRAELDAIMAKVKRRQRKELVKAAGIRGAFARRVEVYFAGGFVDTVPLVEWKLSVGKTAFRNAAVWRKSHKERRWAEGEVENKWAAPKAFFFPVYSADILPRFRGAVNLDTRKTQRISRHQLVGGVASKLAAIEEATGVPTHGVRLDGDGPIAGWAGPIGVLLNKDGVRPEEKD